MYTLHFSLLLKSPQFLFLVDLFGKWLADESMRANTRVGLLSPAPRKGNVSALDSKRPALLAHNESTTSSATLAFP